MNVDITLGNRNQLTKRFNFVKGPDGDVKFDDTQAHAVMTSVMEHLRGYWADPTHGGELHTLKTRSSRTPSQAEAFTDASLQSLQQDGSISEVVTNAKVSSAQTGISILNVTTGWKTPTGEVIRQSVET